MTNFLHTMHPHEIWPYELLHQGDKKYFPTWEPRFLGKYFTGEKKLVLMTKNLFLWQEIHSCHKKSFLVRSHPLVKLIISRQRVNPTISTFRGYLSYISINSRTTLGSYAVRCFVSFFFHLGCASHPQSGSFFKT